MYNRTIKVLNEDSTFQKKNDMDSVTLFDFISPPLFVYLRINLILTYCSDFFISGGYSSVCELHGNVLTSCVNK